MKIFCIALVCLSLVGVSQSRSSGAPNCGRTPNHSGAAASPIQESPFYVEATKESVTLKTTGVGFKGFLVSGVNENGKITGQFSDHGSNLYQLMECGGVPQSTATHVNSTAKFSITIPWTPTEQGVAVQFRATFVENHPTFYVDVMSNFV